MKGKAAAFFATAGGDVAVGLFSLLAVWASFTADEPEAYAFPRLLSLLMAAFAAVNLVRLLVAPAAAPPLTAALLKKIAPAVGVIAAYLAAAESLGFYLSAFLTFALLSFLYDGKENGRENMRAAMFAAAAFVAVLYLLFSLILGVQLPRGLFL